MNIVLKTITKKYSAIRNKITTNHRKNKKDFGNSSPHHNLRRKSQKTLGVFLK